MQINIIHDIHQLDISAAVWNRAVLKSETNTIFQTFEWVRAWWKVYGRHNRLFVIAVYDHKDLIGIAPLMIANDNSNSRTLTFIGNAKADYLDFIAADRIKEVLQKVFDAIFMHRKEWDIISLPNIPEYSSTAEAIKDFCRDRRERILYNDTIICPALLIKGNEQAVAQLSRKKSLRRKFNYLNKNGALRVFQITDEKEALAYLPEFYSQHIERWNNTKFPSLFLQEKNREFYQELMSSLISRGSLLFTVVEFNGCPAAFHFGFQYNGKVIWYKPSFDIQMARYSPGKVLIKHLIEYSMENGIHELDFAVGDEAFKRSYANIVRKNCCIKIYKDTSKYLADYSMFHAKRLLKRTGVFNK